MPLRNQSLGLHHLLLALIAVAFVITGCLSASHGPKTGRTRATGDFAEEHFAISGKFHPSKVSVVNVGLVTNADEATISIYALSGTWCVLCLRRDNFRQADVSLWHQTTSEGTLSSRTGLAAPLKLSRRADYE